MKGKVHKIMNEKSIMKDIELFIELPNGTLKPFYIREGDLIQIVKPTTKDKRKSKKRGEVL